MLVNSWVNLALDNDGDAGNQVSATGTVVQYVYVDNNDDTAIFLNFYDALHTGVTPASTAVTVPIRVRASWAGTIPINRRFRTALTICASNAGVAGGSVPDPAPYVYVAYG